MSIKQETLKVLSQLQALSDGPEIDILENHLPSFVEKVFASSTEEKCAGWSLQNPKYRLLFALVADLTTTKHLRLKSGEFTLVEEFCRLLKGVMINSETKNEKAKYLAVYTMFPTLVNKAAPDVSPFESDMFMGILEQATQIEWGSKHANEQQHQPLVE